MGNTTGRIVELEGCRLRIRDRIGEGGYGFVFVADDMSTGRAVVLKRMSIHNDNTINIALAKNEIKMLTSLPTHPNIVSLYHHRIAQNDGSSTFDIVMEYCEGGNVLQEMWDAEDRGQSLSEKLIVTRFYDACNAVLFLHTQKPPIAHRDLKVENMLLNDRDHSTNTVCKLCDFGSCSTWSGRVLSNADIVRMEDVIERTTTLHYRSPEMVDLHSRQTISIAVDIWALGCVLFKMMYGKTPFEDPQGNAQRMGIISGKVIFPEVPVYSSSLRDLVMLCLVRDPSKRPTIRQVIEYAERHIAAWPTGRHELLGGSSIPNRAPASLDSAQSPVSAVIHKHDNDKHRHQETVKRRNDGKEYAFGTRQSSKVRGGHHALVDSGDTEFSAARTSKRISTHPSPHSSSKNHTSSIANNGSVTSPFWKGQRVKQATEAVQTSIMHLMGGSTEKRRWLVKATSALTPGPPKLKYIRRIIIDVFETGNIRLHYKNVLHLPITSQPVVAAKLCALLLRVWQQGPVNTLSEASLLEEPLHLLLDAWKTRGSTSGEPLRTAPADITTFASYIHTFAQFLLHKLSFHSKRPEFSGLYTQNDSVRGPAGSPTFAVSKSGRSPGTTIGTAHMTVMLNGQSVFVDTRLPASAVKVDIISTLLTLLGSSISLLNEICTIVEPSVDRLYAMNPSEKQSGVTLETSSAVKWPVGPVEACTFGSIQPLLREAWNAYRACLAVLLNLREQCEMQSENDKVMHATPDKGNAAADETVSVGTAAFVSSFKISSSTKSTPSPVLVASLCDQLDQYLGTLRRCHFIVQRAIQIGAHACLDAMEGLMELPSKSPFQDASAAVTLLASRSGDALQSTNTNSALQNMPVDNTFNSSNTTPFVHHTKQVSTEEGIPGLDMDRIEEREIEDDRSDVDATEAFSPSPQVTMSTKYNDGSGSVTPPNSTALRDQAGNTQITSSPIVTCVDMTESNTFAWTFAPCKKFKTDEAAQAIINTPDTSFDVDAALELIFSVPGNSRCAECRAQRPKWVSINLGILLCLQCSGVHRQIGVDISRVRSLTLDRARPEWLRTVLRIGNARSNAYWEAIPTAVKSLQRTATSDVSILPVIKQLQQKLADMPSKPVANSEMKERASFVSAKYVDGLFLAPMNQKVVAPAVCIERNLPISRPVLRRHPASTSELNVSSTPNVVRTGTVSLGDTENHQRSSLYASPSKRGSAVVNAKQISPAIEQNTTKIASTMDGFSLDTDVDSIFGDDSTIRGKTPSFMPTKERRSSTSHTIPNTNLNSVNHVTEEWNGDVLASLGGDAFALPPNSDKLDTFSVQSKRKSSGTNASPCENRSVSNMSLHEGHIIESQVATSAPLGGESDLNRVNETRNQQDLLGKTNDTAPPTFISMRGTHPRPSETSDDIFANDTTNQPSAQSQQINNTDLRTHSLSDAYADRSTGILGAHISDGGFSSVQHFHTAVDSSARERSHAGFSGSIFYTERGTLSGRSGIVEGRDNEPQGVSTRHQSMSGQTQRDHADAGRTRLSALARRLNSLWSDEVEIPFNEIQLGEKIGAGGFAEVFRGFYRGTHVAVKKLLYKPGIDSEKAVTDFKAEVALMTRLRHPNIVLFMGVVTQPLCLVTEYCARGNLFDLLHNSRVPLSMQLRRQMALDSARGMNFLHTATPVIIHRDLKSLNLLVDERWTVKVSDFGLSRFKGNSSSSLYTAQCGTFHWMAPEVIAGHRYTEKADVFSFGINLWELLTRDTPYKGMQPMQVGLAVLHRGLRPTIPSDCPADYAGLMRACWRAEPTKRPSFSQIIQLLSAMVEAG